ncbi:MAG: DeoR/GlpR family DNA-binding transcription regulator [Janthinobacterium lividum]
MGNGSRRGLLLDLLRQGEVDVDDAARRFGVSASTVRRDLRHLAEAEGVTRTYGGALLARPADEQSLRQRETVNHPQKEAIARAALACLADGDSLILDAGSTVSALARLLVGRRHRVVTNSLMLAPMLAEAPDVAMTLLGGAVRTTSMSTLGSQAVEAMRRITADKLFTSADGVVAGRGLCEASPDQTALKETMMAQAGAVYVLADSSKLARASQPHWALPPPCWTLITDSDADIETCRAFEMAGARVIVAAVPAFDRRS